MCQAHSEIAFTSDGEITVTEVTMLRKSNHEKADADRFMVDQENQLSSRKSFDQKSGGFDA